MQENQSRRNGDVAGASLTELVTVLLLALLLSALVTTAVLIAADRYERPALVITDMARPTIVVQVEGAIATPGTYRLPGGSRLDELVDQAGGLADEADPSTLNLAARVGDGEVVHIPARTTAVPATEPPGTATAMTRVNINTATAEELEQLPGIGPVLSERIVAYREQNGPFASLDQVVQVEGISTRLLEDLRPLVTLDG